MTRTTFYSAVRQSHRFPWPASLIGLAALLAGTFATGIYQPAIYAVPAGVIVLAVSPAWWFVRHVIRPQYTSNATARDSEARQRAQGVASALDIAEHAGPTALRKRAQILRPSLAGQRRIDPDELGFLLATTGLGRLPGQRVYSSCEDVTARIGGTRMGKSGSLAHMGQKAPGALITTSTRLDLAENLQQARGGRPVWILNLAKLGDVSSNIRWSVLVGCTNYATAARRAADLLPNDKIGTDGLDWSGKARDLLSLLLHAAALGSRRARDITAWASARDGDSSAAETVADLLALVPAGGAERRAQYLSHFAEAPNTRKSVVATMAPALAWLADDHARPLGDAAVEDITLDIENLLRNGETLHILGHEDLTGVAPLITALVSEVAYQARQLAGRMPGGRLDPHATFLLDECAIICPIPLDRWTADMGGRNISVHISIQSLSQMRDRWGENGAGAILGNLGALIVFGGGTNERDLKALSILSGERRDKILDADGQQDAEWFEHRWTPVMAPDQIRCLPKFEVLLLRQGLRAVIGRAPQVWDIKGWQSMPLPGDPRGPKHASAPTTTLPIPAWTAGPSDDNAELEHVR